MTRTRLIAAGLASALLASAPITPAFAWGRHGGPWFWPFAAGAAVVGTAAAIVTAPLAVVAPPRYPGYGYPGYAHPQAPYYYGPPPGYYGYSPYGPR
jgi:hypothetical protein